MKPIVLVPNSALTKSAQTVLKFDRALEKLITELKMTLLATRNPKGVGLAAPQIGESSRVFITRPKEESKIRVFVNPDIIKRSDEITDGVPDRENKLEGCLSIPTIWGKVKRARNLILRFQDQKGVFYEEEFKGFLATIIQHETDHTNGILYTQRVLEQKGKLYQSKKNDEGKEILEEIII